METMVNVCKELMLYVLYGVIFGGIFLFFFRLLMMVSF